MQRMKNKKGGHDRRNKLNKGNRGKTNLIYK